MNKKINKASRSEQSGRFIGDSKVRAPGTISGEGEEEIMQFDTAGKMPRGKVVTESTKIAVRKDIKK